MLEQMKNLTAPGQYIVFRIDHLDNSIQRKMETFQEAIELIEPGTSVELEIKLTLTSKKRKFCRI